MQLCMGISELRTVPIFVSAHTFSASRKAWFKRHAHAGVDIDAINYAAKYTTTRKQNFLTVTKSSLMNPYLKKSTNFLQNFLFRHKSVQLIILSL